MSRRGWALFVAMGVIWGVPYLLIKVAVEEIEPSVLVLGRTLLAGLLLLPVALARGHLRGLRAAWLPILAFSLIEIAGPWLLLGVAEQRLSSSLTGLLLASVPLVAALLASLTAGAGGSPAPTSAPTFAACSACSSAWPGWSALVGFEVGAGDMSAVLAVAGVSVCYAVGPIILSRWLSHLPGLGVITVSLLVTTVIYLPVGLVQAPAELPSAKVVWSVIGLAVVCTALAFVVFFELIAEVGPSRATVITYLNPAVALLLGVVVLDEAFTVATAVGFASDPRRLGARDPLVRQPCQVDLTERERVPSTRQPVDSDCETVASPVAEP